MRLIVLCALSVFASSVHSSTFIPEASGLTRMGESLLISGDEEPKALWVEESGSVQKVKVKGAEWDDMEGLAQVNAETFFGTTSHSLTKKGKQKVEREQLILFTKEKNKINASSSWSLRADAIALLEKKIGSDLDMKEVTSATPDEGGFNIEGLAYHDGHLYFGLRSPVTKTGKAIILKARNPLTKPEFTDVMVLDLDGLGIRSLDASKDGLVVLAGSKDDAGTTFAIHALNVTTQRAQKIQVNGFENLLRPEGIAVEGETFTFVQDFQEEENLDIIVRLKRN
jgi:hypothetical protein